MDSEKDYLHDFVYDTNLRDLGVFSKQYFNSILYSMYKDIPNGELVCFTFGDFNKLNRINKLHSYEAGDYALKKSLEIILNTLPENTICARIAGDEFCFLNPNISEAEMFKNFEKVNAVLEENKDSIYGLSITASSIDSSVCHNFSEMYDRTESDVGVKKKYSNKSQFKTIDEELSDSLYNGLVNYLSYYRLESGILPKEYPKLLRDSLINILIHNLEKPNPNIAAHWEKIKAAAPENEFKDRHLEVDSEFATQFHNHIINGTDLPTDKETEKKISRVFKFLITDPLTGQISKKFFDTAILPIFPQNKKGNLSVRLFDLAHLKLSNDVIGHNETDEKINELYTDLVSQINAENNSSKYLVSAGNCGLLLIENEDTAIPKERINEMLKNSLDNRQPILNLATVSCICAPNEIGEVIPQLAMICKEQKEAQKLEKIMRKQTILPLQLALKNSMKIYKQTKDPYSMESKQKLLNKIFDILPQVLSEQFTNLDSNLFNEVDKNENEER